MEKLTNGALVTPTPGVYWVADCRYLYLGLPRYGYFYKIAIKYDKYCDIYDGTILWFNISDSLEFKTLKHAITTKIQHDIWWYLSQYAYIFIMNIYEYIMCTNVQMFCPCSCMVFTVFCWDKSYDYNNILSWLYQIILVLKSIIAALLLIHALHKNMQHIPRIMHTVSDLVYRHPSVLLLLHWGMAGVLQGPFIH